MSVCLSVCLFACITRKPHSQFCQIFVHVELAPSSEEDRVIYRLTKITSITLTTGRINIILGLDENNIRKVLSLTNFT